MKAKGKCLVLLSGGVDSATALWWAKAQGWQLATVTFIFPGRRKKELRAARTLAASSGSGENYEITLPFVDAPKADKSCYIPKRNLMFYGIAAFLAEKINAGCIVGGHIRHDREIFPDARPEYLKKLNQLVQSPGKFGFKTKLLFPFLNAGKKTVVQQGARLKVPFEQTWSCSHDLQSHCWKCYSCLERRSGFQSAKLSDPLDTKAVGASLALAPRALPSRSQ